MGFDPKNNRQVVERELKTGDEAFETVFQQAASSSLEDSQRLETILDSVIWTCNPRPENLAFDFRSMVSALLDNAGTLEGETLNLAHAILSESKPLKSSSRGALHRRFAGCLKPSPLE